MSKKRMEWLSSERSPRWQLILGGALVFFLNLGVTYWVQSRDHTASIDMAMQQDVRSRLAEMRLAAVDFQTYAGAYVGAVLDNQDLQTSQQMLIENVMRQYSAIGLSEAIYSSETYVKANVYRDALAEFNTAVSAADGVLEMAPFWDAASRVLHARDEFLQSLEQQALAS